MQQELFLLQEEARVSKRKPYEALQGQVFLFPPPLNRSLMGSPIPNRFTQTLGFPSPIRIIQTHKQIAFQNKNIAGYNLKTRKLDRSRHLSSFNESRSPILYCIPVEITFHSFSILCQAYKLDDTLASKMKPLWKYFALNTL